MREGFNPFFIQQPAPHAGRPRIRFSSQEVTHLAGAVILLTFCFALAGKADQTFMQRLAIKPLVLAAGLLAVSTGFVLHELAHKVVAQHYGHWAEFRAQFSNLFISLAMALAFGFFFAAPGAVMIQGNVTRRENGLISLVGPGTNLLIAGIAWPFSFATNPTDALPTILTTVAFVNAFLCVFNLMPFGPLDGRKVWNWNPAVYVVTLVAAVVLLVSIWIRLPR